MKSPYEVLGITVGTSKEDAKRAYRRLSMQYHPDRNPGNPEASEKYLEVQAAWRTLESYIPKKSVPIWLHKSLFSIHKGGEL
jgi:curved DNA-binding protein CbpA